MFSEAHFDHLEYEFHPPSSAFKIDTFKKEMAKSKPRSSGYTGTSYASSANEEDDYHVHFSWRFLATRRKGSEAESEGERVRLKVEYFSGNKKPDPSEKPPFADGVMQWLAQFFESDQARAHVDGYLSYPRDHWAFTVPLPIKIPIAAEKETQIVIDGMSAKLPKQILGISRVYMFGAEEEQLGLGVHGERTVYLSGFDLKKELGELGAPVALFIREREAKQQ